MLLQLALLPSAHALTCDPDDVPCTSAESIAALANTLANRTLIADTGVPGRRRTGTVRTRLQAAHDALDAAGCTLEGVAVALYAGGSYDGGWEADATSGSLLGAVDAQAKTLDGSFDGDESGLIGHWSRFEIGNRGRVAARWGTDGFLAGAQFRLSGNRGVAYGMTGSCPGDVAAALEPWWPLLDRFDTTDLDGDGHVAVPIGGDCDDEDPSVHPGATEATRNHLDDDCDLEVDEETDADADGYYWWEDCDEADASINPGQSGAEGVVDGVDNDCDGLVDDDVDQDSDGFTPAEGDCDDIDSGRRPGLTDDTPNGIDDDCDALIDDEVDQDGDGWTLAQHDCDDGDPVVNPGAALAADSCDADQDGYLVARYRPTGVVSPSAPAADCDDANPAANPGIPLDGPSADGVDDDCNGNVDDDVDQDGDGFTPRQGDCDDGHGGIYPGAFEVLGDGLNSDCVGSEDSYLTPNLGIAEYVPAGSFAMGCDPLRDEASGIGCASDEAPVHDVTLTQPLWAMRLEVKQGVYQTLIGSNPSFDLGADLPVEQVTWDEANALANAVNADEGLPQCAGDGSPASCAGWRLPTEAEWEYLARAGESLPFAGGATAAAVARFRVNSASSGAPPELSTDRGCGNPLFPRGGNPWGLCDLSGNVAEWTSDWFGGYSTAETVDPTGPADGRARVVRGGGFRSPLRAVRVAARSSVAPDRFDLDVGFRLVRSLSSAVDHDQDGYTPADGDCDSADPTRNPGVAEVPGDGIDNDCDGETDES